MTVLALDELISLDLFIMLTVHFQKNAAYMYINVFQFCALRQNFVVIVSVPGYCQYLS